MLQKRVSDLVGQWVELAGFLPHIRWNEGENNLICPSALRRWSEAWDPSRRSEHQSQWYNRPRPRIPHYIRGEIHAATSMWRSRKLRTQYLCIARFPSRPACCSSWLQSSNRRFSPYEVNSILRWSTDGASECLVAYCWKSRYILQPLGPQLPMMTPKKLFCTLFLRHRNKVLWAGSLSVEYEHGWHLEDFGMQANC